MHMYFRLNRKILLVCILLILSNSIFAHVSPWLGTGLINDTTNLDSSEKKYFQTIMQDSNGKLIGNTDDIENIIYLGPSFDFTIFPYKAIPIGISLSDQLLFPIGYNNNISFISYNTDLKNKFRIGLSYAQSFTSKFGLFLDTGFEYNHYRTAKENLKNNKGTPDYFRFDNYGLYGALGLLTEIEHGYFKFGFDYYHSLLNNNSSYSLIFMGGYIF